MTAEDATQDTPANPTDDDLAYYSDKLYAKLFPVIEIVRGKLTEQYPIGHSVIQPIGAFAGQLEVFFQPRETWLSPVLIAVYRTWDAYYFVRA